MVGADPREDDGVGVGVDWVVLDAALAEYDADSLVALLTAAAVSPTAVHRLPSIRLLWDRTVVVSPAGRRQAMAAHLKPLLAAARRAAPWLVKVEDFFPSDPRRVVRTRVGDVRLRVHPGASVRPTAQLFEFSILARVLDGDAKSALGFGLSDLLEVGLRCADLAVANVCDTWGPDRPSPDFGQSPFDVAAQVAGLRAFVTDEEVRRCRRRPPDVLLADAAAASRHPDRARRAVSWATVEADDCRDSGIPDAALAVRRSGIPRVVPASCVIEALAHLAARLAAALASPALEQALADIGTLIVRQTVLGPRLVSAAVPPTDETGHAEVTVPKWMRPVEGEELSVPDRPGSHHEAPSLALVLDSRHLLVVDVLATLRSAEREEKLDTTLAAAACRTVQDLVALGVPADPSAELTRIVVTMGPGHWRIGYGNRPVVVTIGELIELFRRTADEGRERVWVFLDELNNGGVEILGGDILDVYNHWDTYGALVPLQAGWVPRTDCTVAIDFTLDDPTWDRDADWEPTNEILHNLHMPPVWEAAAARIEADGRIDIWVPGAACVNAVAAPSLVCVAGIARELYSLRIEPELPVVLATGIRDTALACGLVQRLARPVSLLVFVKGAETTMVKEPTGPMPTLRLTIGMDWLSASAGDCVDAHARLGAVVVDALREWLTAETDTQRLIDDWGRLPPILITVFDSASLAAVGPRDHLPDGLAEHVRAAWALADALRGTDLPAGVSQGKRAAALCRDVILPAAHDALANGCADFDHRMLLASALARLGDAHANRVRQTQQRDLGLTAPWAGSVRDQILDEPDDARPTRALETLIEHALSRPPSGERRADRFDLARLSALAAQTLSIAQAGHGHVGGGGPIVVNENGIVLVTGVDAAVPVGDAAPDLRPGAAVENDNGDEVDLTSWLSAVNENRARIDPFGRRRVAVPAMDAELPLGASVAQTFEPLPPLQGRLRRLDAAMHEALGCGIDSFVAVLGTVADFPVDDRGIVVASSAALTIEAHKWSNVPHGQLSAAIEMLTLRGFAVRAEGLKVWELHRRSHRLATRPLVAVGSELWTAPWVAHTTQRIFSNYLTSGQLPWTTSDVVPSALSHRANDFRQVITRGFERDLPTALARTGLPYIPNLTPERAQADGVPLRGEIDAIVADQERARLWVIEMKGASLPRSLSQLRPHVSRFTKRDGYVDRLVGNTETIADHADWAARLTGVQPIRTWHVRPLIVSAEVEPAAFVANPRVAFTVLEDLAAVLMQDDDPPPGHAPIGTLSSH